MVPMAKSYPLVRITALARDNKRHQTASLLRASLGNQNGGFCFPESQHRFYSLRLSPRWMNLLCNMGLESGKKRPFVLHSPFDISFEMPTADGFCAPFVRARSERCRKGPISYVGHVEVSLADTPPAQLSRGEEETSDTDFPCTTREQTIQASGAMPPKTSQRSIEKSPVFHAPPSSLLEHVPPGQPSVEIRAKGFFKAYIW